MSERTGRRIPLWASIFLAMLIIGTYNYSYLLRIMYKSIPDERDFDMAELEESIMKDMFAVDNSMMGVDHDHPAAVPSLSTKSSSSSLTSSSLKQQPPEPLDTIDWCAEKCRYIPEMCTENLHRKNLSLPAPTCLEYSLTVADDKYWSDHKKGGRGVVKERNEKTNKLISWAAAQARARRTQQSPSSTSEQQLKCEDEPTDYKVPMMFPEEFEFIVKLMANLKPRTYLEWGCGKSTSFYPLLASENVIAIDGYPPWCKKIEEEPRVHCMTQKERRLQFYCPALVGVDGSSMELKEMGKIPRETSDANVEHMMGIYVDSIDNTNVTSLDLALVDGRFRFQCALKLLPYLSDDSVLLIHDFWVRQRKGLGFTYHKVFDYYYVIGYARSIVALKKKPNLGSLSEQRNVYKEFMKRKYLSRDDLEI